MNDTASRGLKRYAMDITESLPRMVETPDGAWFRADDVLSILLKIKTITDKAKEAFNA